MSRGVIWGFLLLVAGFSISAKSADEDRTSNDLVSFLYDYLDIKYQNLEMDEFIYVAAQRQRLYLIKDRKIVSKHTISTSKYGIGSTADSEKTPLGLHRIYSKFGGNTPLGGILKERRYIGKEAQIITDPIDIESDDVTTRILWLEGLEPGVNKGGNLDSRRRCIYIHGTPEEGLLGQPASHGCIRMKNEEIINLYDQAGKGMHVIILNN